jgi:Flp pilus assembly pilin Flp
MRPIALSDKNVGNSMKVVNVKCLTESYVRLCELRRRISKGQTMTEYALIMAAIAVVVYATYVTMGTDISTLVGKVNTDLTAS